jgi:hypothetical protein
MDELRDFKKIADEAMFDINVTDEMMDKVLKKGTSSKRLTGKPLYRLAAMAACGIMIYGIIHFTGMLRPNVIDMQQDDQPGIFSANQPEGAGPEIGIRSEPGIQQWQPASPEEAAESFGEGFLIPSYIPEGFQPADIYASGTAAEGTDSVVLNYLGGDRSFHIMEQRSEEAWKFPGFETIDINGADGFVNSLEQFTEVYWYGDGVQYSVSGALTRDEAIMTARAMVPAAK